VAPEPPADQRALAVDDPAGPGERPRTEAARSVANPRRTRL
jgi:hypothetical protein